MKAVIHHSDAAVPPLLVILQRRQGVACSRFYKFFGCPLIFLRAALGQGAVFS